MRISKTKKKDLPPISPDELFLWNERAAIREFCGNQDRQDAEVAAWQEVFKGRLPFHGKVERQALLFPINAQHHP